MTIIDPIVMSELLWKFKQEEIEEILKKEQYLHIENITYDVYLDTNYPDLYQRILIENIHHYCSMKELN